jgi:hypothetical protein
LDPTTAQRLIAQINKLRDIIAENREIVNKDIEDLEEYMSDLDELLGWLGMRFGAAESRLL